MIDDAMVKAIIEISNNEKVIKQVEPELCWHMKIEEWMVKRIFKAIELIQEAYEIQQGKQSDNQHSKPRRSKGVRKVSEKRNYPA